MSHLSCIFRVSVCLLLLCMCVCVCRGVAYTPGTWLNLHTCSHSTHLLSCLKTLSSPSTCSQLTQWSLCSQPLSSVFENDHLLLVCSLLLMLTSACNCSLSCCPQVKSVHFSYKAGVACTL